MARLVRAATDRNPPTSGGGGCQLDVCRDVTVFRCEYGEIRKYGEKGKWRFKIQGEKYSMNSLGVSEEMAMLEFERRLKQHAKEYTNEILEKLRG